MTISGITDLITIPPVAVTVGPISGTVAVSNFPNPQNVDVVNTPNVVVTNFPPNQPITGTVQVSGLSIAGKITYVTIDNTQWWALPPVAQAMRNSVAIQNKSGTDILIGFDPIGSLSIGWLVYNQGEFSIDVTNSIPIYATAITPGTFNLTIMELS